MVCSSQVPLMDAANQIIARLQAGEEVSWEERQVMERANDVHRQWSNLVGDRGSRYQQCRLSNYVVEQPGQRELVDKLSEYSSEFRQRIDQGQNIVLFGPKGTGKDHCLMAMAHEAFRYGVTVTWKNGVELFGDVRDAMSTGDTERSMAARLERADVLWISDPLPPSGSLTDFQQSFLFRIIDKRYSMIRPTWISVNVANGSEAEERMGPQIVDRLREGALTHFCNWESKRQSK